jgi:hypothetical protein
MSPFLPFQTHPSHFLSPLPFNPHSQRLAPPKAMKSILLFVGILTSIAPFSYGAVNIIVNSYDSTSFDLTVTGVVDAVNTNNLDRVFFGINNGGNSSWISDSGTESITNIGSGANYQPVGQSGSTNFGGFYYSAGNTLEVGDTVQFDFITTGASFNWSTYNPTDFVVQVGYTSVSPEIVGGSNVLTGVVVPEPSAST